MRKYLLFLKVIPLFTLTPAFNQKTSVSVYVGSGLSSFGGPGAAENTTYYVTDVLNIPSTVGDPYGRKPITNWVAGARLDRQLHNKWIFSLDAQYEFTGGTVTIDHSQSRTGVRDTSGEYSKKLHFISINPQAGFLVLKKRINVVASAGIDYAIGLAGSEEYIFHGPNGIPSITAGSGIQGSNDFRLTGTLLFAWKKWGLDLGYKHGLSNYWKGSNEKVFSRIFHFRLLFTVWQ